MAVNPTLFPQSITLPTNFIFDVSQLYSVNVNSDEFKELLVRLYQNINSMNVAINAKESSYYATQEILNGQFYFPNPLYTSQTTPFVKAEYRPVLRRLYNLPQAGGIALLAGVTTVAHLITITSMTTFTRIYGVANNTGANNYYPLPWVSAAGATNIEVKVDATNITITNNSGIAFENCYIVLEWLSI